MSANLRAEAGEDGASRRVGWVGAGKMGAPMIRNLLSAGIPVAVTEPVPERIGPLVADGASEARAAADHRTSDLVFSTLPNDGALLDVVLGTATQAGLAGALAPGAVFVDMSTVSPGCSAKVASALADRGVLYLRAPLSGSTVMAERASLTILASGDEDAWAAAVPYLERMSQRRFFLGHGDEARYMKLVVNTLVGATSAILSEALSLGESGGLDRAAMMEVICESAVASPLLGYKRDAVVSGDFEPAFTIGQMIKDFTLICEAGRGNGVPLFTTGLILELYRAAANAGLSERDFFALVKWHSSMSAMRDLHGGQAG
jgi:3-hydroxyisobutyrate dehydrogenase